MSTVYIATIPRKDYETFRRFFHDDIPDSYDEWLYLVDQKRTDAIKGGDIAVLVEVYPDEFASYCTTSGTTYTLKALQFCAFDKASRKKH